MDLSIIKKISEKKGIPLKRIAENIGMSEQNLHRCIKNNNIKADSLGKIAAILNIPIQDFFDEKQAYPTNDVRNNMLESKAIYELLNDKERIIKLQYDKIKSLEEELRRYKQ